MAEIQAHTATLGATAVDQRVLRSLLRIQRLEISLANAGADRAPQLLAEIDALDASFGGKRVRDAMVSALAEELKAQLGEAE